MEINTDNEIIYKTATRKNFKSIERLLYKTFNRSIDTVNYAFNCALFIVDNFNIDNDIINLINDSGAVLDLVKIGNAIKSKQKIGELKEIQDFNMVVYHFIFVFRFFLRNKPQPKPKQLKIEFKLPDNKINRLFTNSTFINSSNMKLLENSDIETLKKTDVTVNEKKYKLNIFTEFTPIEKQVLNYYINIIQTTQSNKIIFDLTRLINETNNSKNNYSGSIRNNYIKALKNLKSKRAVFILKKDNVLTVKDVSIISETSIDIDFENEKQTAYIEFNEKFVNLSIDNEQNYINISDNNFINNTLSSIEILKYNERVLLTSLIDQGRINIKIYKNDLIIGYITRKDKQNRQNIYEFFKRLNIEAEKLGYIIDNQKEYIILKPIKEIKIVKAPRKKLRKSNT